VPAGLDPAAARAAVVIVGIAVVTGFARLTVPVATANSGNTRLPGRRAFEIRLQLADSGTAVTAHSVAVIAGFAQILLHDSVAAVGAGIRDRIALATVRGTGLPGGSRSIARVDATSIEIDGERRRTTGILATTTRYGAAARAVGDDARLRACQQAAEA
jgi:hypothetical protein